MSRRFCITACLLLLSTIAQAQPPDYDLTQVQAPLPAAPGELIPPQRGGIDLLLNGSFETNGGAGTNILDDWTVVNLPGSIGGTPGSGDWFAQTGAASPLNAFPVDAPTDGSFAAMTDTTGAGAHALYQDFTVPSGGGELSCDVYINNQNTDFVDGGSLDWEAVPNQHARVDLMDPTAPVDDVGAGVLANLFFTDPGDPTVQSYQTIVASLNDYAGETIRLRFAEVDNQFFFNAGVDNCVATGIEASDPIVEVPTLGQAGIVALILLLIAVGFFVLKSRKADA